MKSLIYGYGKTGESFERYLNKKNLKFDIFDKNIKKYSKKYDLTKYDQILCSPGIPKDIYHDILCKNKNVLTDLDLFFQEDNSIKIGITGTNRKSTTAYHLYQLFKDFDSVNLIGNIGNPMLDSINSSKYSILELSSFQLDKMITNNLDFGILLNIDVDHLDYHGDFESYKEAKEKILLSKKFIKSEIDPCKLFKWITKTDAKEIIFKNLPYRYQIISEKVINDSKCTNFHALKYAIKKTNKKFFDSEYILIVCGDPKKEGNREIEIFGPEEIYIFGKHSKQIDKCIKHSNKKIFETLEEIFKSLNSQKICKNILFSPGYPSGEDFANFEERGDVFNKIFKKYSI